jgi:hypothetical protein
MNLPRQAETDERLETVLQSNTWGFNFILFGLLIDIMYRSLVFHEAPWDLFALIGLSGVVTMAYAARHNVLLVNRQLVFVLALTAVIAAAVAALLAAMRVM